MSLIILLVAIQILSVFSWKCPNFNYRSIASTDLAFTTSPHYTWHEAQSLCEECLGSHLADVPNAVFLAEGSTSIQTYWIGQYDGGSVEPYLTWYTGTSPAVVVLPSSLSTRRNFVCNAPSGSMTDSTDDHATRGPKYGVVAIGTGTGTGTVTGTEMTGLVTFAQLGFSSLLQTMANLTGLRANTYYQLSIHTYGDASISSNGTRCSFIGPVFDVLKRTNASASELLTGDLGVLEADSNGEGMLNFNSSRLTLFGEYSILGRALVVRSLNSSDLECGVIGIGSGEGGGGSNGGMGEVSVEVQGNLTGAAGNVTAQGGGNVTAEEGGNATAQGEGNMTAQGGGGGNMTAQGGGNVTAQGGGNMTAQGGGNVTAQGGGNMTAQGGGNVTAQGGGNMTAQGGGGNMTAQGGGNVTAQGGGNMTAQGGGNMTAQRGGNMTAQGGGNVTAQEEGNVTVGQEMNRTTMRSGNVTVGQEGNTTRGNHQQSATATATAVAAAAGLNQTIINKITINKQQDGKKVIILEEEPAHLLGQYLHSKSQNQTNNSTTPSSSPS